jgi:hypothetical protein
MPDISDLLHDAASDPTGYDEDDVRSRVARRRRGRRIGVAVAAAVAVLGALGIARAVEGGDDRSVVADGSTTTTTGGHWAAFGATSVAIVGDQIWIGGDGYVSLGDGSHRIAVPGAVNALAAGDAGLLWVRGDHFVAAVDTGAHDAEPVRETVPERLVDTWQGDAADLVPLPSGHVAISVPATDEVVIVRTAAEGLEELERIPTHDAPGDLVRAANGDLWVREGSDGKERATIAKVDWGAGGITERCDWGYPLFAPALDGTIWTTDGDRVVSLDLAILQTGALSAAIGERYDVDATMAVETPFGLYTGGPGGVRRFSQGTPGGEVITTDVPEALDASGGQVAYVVGGEVRTAQAHGDSTVDPEAWRREPRQVAARYLSDELHWPDVIIDSDEETEQGNADAHRIVHATSATLGRNADVTLQLYEGAWSVQALWTFLVGEEHPGSVSLGNGSDHVAFDYRDAALKPVLTVRYGESRKTIEGAVGGEATWDGDLGFVPDTLGFVQVLYVDEHGVALEGWATSVAPGPFAAG